MDPAIKIDYTAGALFSRRRPIPQSSMPTHPVSTALAAPLGYRPVRILDDDPPLVSAESTP